jgi:chorismate dehydratase
MSHAAVEYSNGTTDQPAGGYPRTISDVREGRDLIDRIDTEVLRLLAHRRQVSGQIQALRTSSGGPCIDPSREREVVGRFRAAFGDVGTELADIVLRSCRSAAGVAPLPPPRAAGGAGTGELSIGWYPYLNCAPLRWGLGTTGPAEPRAALVAAPDHLAGALLGGELDIAPITLVEFLRHGQDLLVLPDLAIGSTGPVMSCHLISTREPERLGGRPVALCSTSRTTVTFARILLERRFGVRPRYHVTDPHLPTMLREADAAVLIGDTALLAGQHPPAGTTVYDIGELWHGWTGLPSVFAVWAVRRSAAAAAPQQVADLHARLRRAARAAAAAPHRAAAAACQAGAPVGPDLLTTYFRRLDYRFGAPQLSAVRRFAQLAAALGEVPDEPVIELFEAAPAEESQ